MASFLKPWTWFGSQSLSRNDGVQLSEPMTRSAEATEPVNFDTAMQLSAFWAAVRLWAETIASLPVKVQRLDPTDEEWKDAQSSDLAALLRTKPNRYQNRVEFFETFVLNHVVFGNAYARKIYSGDRLIGLLPLNSGQVLPELLSDGTVVYNYHHNGGVAVLSAENVWHWKMYGNGVTGLSPLAYARNSVSVGLAGDKRISQVFRNAGKPSGVLTIDGTLKPEQRDLIRSNFRDLVSGGTDTLMVLEAAMKFQPISMSPTEFQLLDSRRFQVEDVARFMDVPSVLINDTQGTTSWGSSVSEIMRGWYKRSLRNRVNSLQESMRCSLIPIDQRARTRICHDFDDLLKLDKGERMEAHQKGIQSAVITPNEARREEDLPPMEGGDQLYANGAILPLNGRTPNAKPPNARIDMAEDEDE